MSRTLLRRAAPAVAAAALVPVAAGCGGAGGDPDADPSALVPQRAPVYVEATIKPEGDRANTLKELGRKIGGTDDPAGELKRALEKEVRESQKDFSYKDDVEPWLGNRGAFFVSALRPGDDSEGAAILAVKDSDKAKESLEKLLNAREQGEPPPKITTRKYKDVEYKVETNDDTAVAIVSDQAVIGTDGGIRAAIDASDGAKLSDAQDFKSARDRVGADGLGLAYVKFDQLLSGLGPQAASVRPFFNSLGKSFAMGVDATQDAIQAETAQIGVPAGGPAGGPGRVLGTLPGDAWAALGTADIGGQFERALRQFEGTNFNVDQIIRQLRSQTGLDLREDLINWMGDGAAFVRGTSAADIGGALVVQSKDPAATRRAIPKIARVLRQQGGAQLRVRELDARGATGVTIEVQGLPVPVHMATAGERFILAFSDAGLQQAIDPARPLSQSAAFREAAGKLGDGIQPSAFVDLGPVAKFVDQTGAANDEDERRARRALDALTTIVLGSKREGDVVRGKLVIGVK